MASSKDEKKHRGVLQAQGVDIKQNNGTVSKAWAELLPYKAVAAHADLDVVHGQLTAAQQAARAEGFEQAREYIDRCKAAGGVTATGRRPSSFPRLKPDESDIRVDIEVKSGTAFV